MIAIRDVRLAQVAIVAALAAALLMFAAPDVTEARTKRQACLQAAGRAIGHKIKAPGSLNIVLGTRRADRFVPTARRDLFCGFGGNDLVNRRPLRPGDIVLGGRGSDLVVLMRGGRFFGGDRRDGVAWIENGRFFGGRGNDVVGVLRGGTFIGGRGRDRILGGRNAGFDGPGTFLGGPGDDVVEEQSGGTYDGGTGTDSVLRYIGGTLISVETCVPDDGAACP